MAGMETVEPTPESPVYTKRQFRLTNDLWEVVADEGRGAKTVIVEEGPEWFCDWIIGHLQGKPLPTDRK